MRHLILTIVAVVLAVSSLAAGAAPTISGLSPISGPVGTSVTITGSHFGTTQGTSTVTFNGVKATPSSWGSTKIVAPVPSGATTGPVVVTVGGVSSNGVTFSVAPSITSLSPTSGPVATSVTINGATFGAAQGTSTVTFNGVSAAPTSWSATSIVAPVPTPATTGPVVVTVAGLASNGATFTVSPSITSLSPISGAVGTSVTISGTTFGTSQGTSTVTFNGTAATPTSWSATQIIAPVPAGATTGPVVVTVSGQASNGVTFTVPPSITSLTPSSGTVSTSVSIAGYNFGASQGTSTVTFNGAAASPTTWSTTTIAAPVPANATTGPVVVTVGGLASAGVSFTVTPVISTISPTSGGPNTFVTIGGSGFGPTRGTSAVTFNGVATQPTSWSATSILGPVPGNASTGPVVVTVGGVASNGATFTFSSSGTIAGTVTRQSDGAAVGGATVEAVQSGIVKALATTNASGAYSIAGLNAGAYDIGVLATGYLNAEQAGVFVAGGATATTNFALSVPVIGGLSPSSGPVGTTVTITGSSFGPTQASSTVSFNGTLAAPTGWSNTSVVVAVPSGATTGPVVVTVQAVASNGAAFTVGAGSIAGKITNASGGSAVSGALVEALQSNAARASASTAADGTYTISNLPPGTYDVRISASGFGTSILTGNAVTVGSTTTLNAALSAAGTISGKVTKSNGLTAIAGATVTALQGIDTAGTATTDTTGSYAIATLSAGTYSAQAAANGFNTQTQANLSVTAGGATTANFALPGQDVVSYFYDALSRLIGASDSLSNTAAYSYDAVGNLLSIADNPSAQISIIGFDPGSGPAGTSVTVSGTGFSPTASQDTVSFTGATATITSATSTQIVATVPSGATTGTIVVTAPAGSATSKSSFTVTASAGAPTIASFSPTIATAGTAAAITGANFDTTATNDRVELNITLASVSSATSTTISTSVPANTSSGHLSVTTPTGKVVSAGYLFVPPPSYLASAVGFAGPIPFGTSSPATLPAGQIGLLVFDGTAAQRVSLNLSITPGTCCMTASILSPSLATQASPTRVSTSTFIDTTTLPATGSYTLFLVPDAGVGGTVTTTLYSVPPDVTGTITPTTAGSTVTFGTTTPGQNASLTFLGSAGQRIFLNLSTSTGACCITVSILDPSSNTLASTRLSNTAYIDTTTLPVTGTYTIFFNPDAALVYPSITSTLYNVPPDVTGTITPTTAGSTVTFGTTTPGQNASLTFSGTAGQRIFLNLSTSTGACCITVSILDPSSNTLASTRLSNTAYIDTTTLPVTGTYTIFFNPDAALVYPSITSTLYLVPPDATGSVTINGSSLAVTISTPGQNAEVTFSGTAGQSVTVQLSANNLCYVRVSLLPPGGGSALTSTFTCNAAFNLASQSLPSTGTYTVFIDPQIASTGSITVAVTSP